MPVLSITYTKKRSFIMTFYRINDKLSISRLLIIAGRETVLDPAICFQIAGYSPGTIISRGNNRLFILDATSASSITNCLRCILNTVCFNVHFKTAHGRFLPIIYAKTEQDMYSKIPEQFCRL